MQVGNYGWEDSIEISSNITWTPKLPQNFQKKFGYSIIQYLPLLMYGNNNINLQGAGSYLAVLDTVDSGARHVNDYRSVLADGYQEYLTELTNWTNSYLNLQMSAQVSYNLPMDAEASIPFVNAPESESLQFEDKIDSYRQYSGPANLAGKRVVSIELGAIATKAFIYTLPNLLRQFNLAVCGGVNQAVLHGQAYSGEYYATTWPGYNSFSWLISENYNNKHPYWDNGFAEVLEYMGRVQYVQQTGVPKVDVVFYNKVSATAPYWDVQYQFSDLSDAGWTYSYLSPENFKFPQATVQNGVFAPEGPAYKAMVITSSSNMTLSGVRYIQGYADAGLPIIISGGNPSPYPSVDDQEAILASISKLKASKNVYSVGKGEIASKLTSLGLVPNAAVHTNGTCHSTWRQDDHNSVGYAFIMCEGGYSTGTLRVPTKATPSVLDAWTGEERPILSYSLDSSGFTTIPISLASNQTMIVAFRSKPINGTGNLGFHATSLPPNALGCNLIEDKEIVVQLAAPTSSLPQGNSVVLSNGAQYAINQNTTLSSSFLLSNWSLTVEHWEAPVSLLNVSIQAIKHNTTHHLGSLVSWLDVPAIANTSGVGYYSTSFSWPPAQGSADGAYIKFSPILNAVRLYINGKRIPPFDPNAPKADIGPYLRNGENDVLAVVPSTMGNYLNTILSRARNGDGSITIFGLLGVPITPTDQGLVGDVAIIPYQEMRIKG
ncbi:hypothetical protein BGZ60DRAFT_416619 [Tricladium varicosporioides]|nr:hypothetical protein BGZ60DRAFT_416619 [Hymenoscyphus varicosporioides]